MSLQANNNESIPFVFKVWMKNMSKCSNKENHYFQGIFMSSFFKATVHFSEPKKIGANNVVEYVPRIDWWMVWYSMNNWTLNSVIVDIACYCPGMVWYSNLRFIVQRTVTMSMYWGDFTCFTATTHFVANYVEFCKKRNFTGYSRFITVLHKFGNNFCFLTKLLV